MNTASLEPGDRVECCVRGVPFVATFEGHRPHRFGLVPIMPVHPRRFTYRAVKPRQIVKKLESGVEG